MELKYILTQSGLLKSKFVFNEIEDVFFFLKEEFCPFNPNWIAVMITAFRVSYAWIVSVQYHNLNYGSMHTVNYEIMKISEYLSHENK